MTKTSIDGFPQGQDFGKEQTKIGFLFGGLTKIDMSKRFQLEWQLRFSNKGMRKGINPDHNDYTTWIVSLNYMEAPLILTANIWKRMYISAGISIGGLVSNKIKDPDKTLVDSLKNTSYKRYELSHVLYLSYKFNQPIYLFLGTNYSILPINTGSKPILWNINGHGNGFYNLSWNFGLKYNLFEQKTTKKASQTLGS